VSTKTIVTTLRLSDGCGQKITDASLSISNEDEDYHLYCWEDYERRKHAESRPPLLTKLVNNLHSLFSEALMTRVFDAGFEKQSGSDTTTEGIIL
jgi:hypothetical protein